MSRIPMILAMIVALGGGTLLTPSAHAQAQPPAQSLDPVPELVEDPAKDLSSEEQQFLNEEYQPPKEAPYTTEVDPVTAEPVLVKKDQATEANPETPDEKPAAAPEIENVAKSTNHLAIPHEEYNRDGLKSVSAKGEYFYNIPASPQIYSASLKVGAFLPPNLSNKLENGTEIAFSDLYGNSQATMFLFDVEWQFMQSVGKLGIRAGSGFYSATGNGRFKRDSTLVSREIYTFYLMPNSIDLVYHAQFWDKQPFVPYAFGGGNYFTFLESRDDNSPAKYGGAAAANFGGGFQLLLDALDRQSINQLDKDYGINHIWLTGEYQVIVGLNTKFDFSNQFFAGGILVEF